MPLAPSLPPVGRVAERPKGARRGGGQPKGGENHPTRPGLAPLRRTTLPIKGRDETKPRPRHGEDGGLPPPAGACRAAHRPVKPSPRPSARRHGRRPSRAAPRSGPNCCPSLSLPGSTGQSSNHTRQCKARPHPRSRAVATGCPAFAGHDESRSKHARTRFFRGTASSRWRGYPAYSAFRENGFTQSALPY